MNIKKIVLNCLLLAGIAVHSMTWTAQAQPGIPAGYRAEGTDFILLVDESGSMCGSSVHSGQNDPLNKRNQFLKLILPDILKSQDRGLRHRMSIVEFGSRHGTLPKWRAQVSLSAFQFPAREMDEDDHKYFGRVFGPLEKLTEDRNRGNTDHGAALRLALEEIKKLDKTPVPVPLGYTGGGKRLKVIVLITDGKPFLPNMAENDQLREIKNLVRQIPRQDAVLFVLGLNADTDYWFSGGFGQFWREAAIETSDNENRKGDAIYIRDHDEIYVAIAPLLRKYINNQGSGDCCRDSYDCPPYLKSVEFTIEYSVSYQRLEDSIRIIDPNGDPVPYHFFKTDKTFALLKVNHPRYGTWKFEIDEKNPCKVIWKEEWGIARYVEPLPPFPVNTAQNIRFRLDGKDSKHRFTPLDQFPLEGVVLIRTPSGKEEPLNTEPDPGEPGLFVSTAPYTFAEPGVYQVRFTGTTVSASGEPKTVVSSIPKDLAVVDSRPVSILLKKPSSLGSIFGGIDDEAVISFQTQGKDIPVREILNERPGITANLEFRTPESRLTEPVNIPLQYRDGVLVGPLQFNIAWRFMPEFLGGDIQAKLTLNLDNKLLKKKYFLKDPGTLSRLYEFQIPVSPSLWIYFLIFLLIFGPCAAAVYFMFFRKRSQTMSQDVPVLVYRHGNKFEPDHTVTKPLEIFKRKIVFNKKVKTPFDIPGIPDQWEPLLTVSRHAVPRGVKVSVTYEKYKANKKDKERFHQVHLETTDNNDPGWTPIKGLEPYEMIFQLKIKEDDSTPGE